MCSCFAFFSKAITAFYCSGFAMLCMLYKKSSLGLVLLRMVLDLETVILFVKNSLALNCFALKNLCHFIISFSNTVDLVVDLALLLF